MLVYFSIGNFRSFDKDETFSMEAGKTRNFSERTLRTCNGKITKFKTIYGANASGKSNLIKAIDFMDQSVRFGVPSSSTMEYCRRTDTNAGIPSKFEVEIIVDGTQYTYGFEVMLATSTFTKEWLYELNRKKYKKVFSRDIITGEYDIASYMSDSTLVDRLSFYADDVKQDGSILFLQVMNKNKDSLYETYPSIVAYKKVYRWFCIKLSVNYPNDPITQYTYFFDSDGSAKAEELLSRFDTGISKVQICDEPAEKIKTLLPKAMWLDIENNLSEQKRHNEDHQIDRVPAVMIRSSEDHSMYIVELNGEDVSCKTLRFNHEHSTSYFSLREESDGTVRLLDLLEVLLSDNKGMVYFIDEVSRCLHPVLTKKLIKDFLSLAAERDIQLIVTTHEVNLLDLDVLRQDEICFIGKRDDDGTSSIFGLEQFGARFDKRIRRAYLDGEYGGVPKLGNDKQL